MDHLKPELLNISIDEWKMTFLPQELGPDYQMRPSQCSMFNVSKEDVPRFLSRELPGNQSSSWDKLDCRSNGGWNYSQRYEHFMGKVA